MQSVLHYVRTLRGHVEFNSGHTVLADVMAVHLATLEEMLQNILGGGAEEVTLSEAKKISGLSDSYYRARLQVFGGESRLEKWAREGLARQQGRMWLINRGLVPQRRRPQQERHSDRSRFETEDLSEDIVEFLKE